ncbi:MAG: PQQ-binding-like beta-propeller repeat protein, partial [Planctomycetaceae bacterium]|nr:PQQ-binding-like beta-propeller repeat protein [Planctomycetaceae bacterium]
MRDFVQVLRTGLIALMTTAGLVSVSPGQVFLPSPDSAGNLTLPVDPDLSAALAVAQHEIAAENWVRAANVLQLILDVDEDAFVSPFESPRSVRRSASQLLVEMPLAGRQQYERLYGPAAESLWRQVESDGNLEAHSELLRRFLHTTVGRQAAWRMAVMRQDQGASLSAALLLEQLVVDPSSASLFGAELELRAALAWQAAGRSERAATHLDAIAERNIESVELLGTTLTIPGDSAARSEWLAGLAGAVVDRSAALSGAGVAPFLPPRDAADWHVPAVCEDDLLAMYPDRAQKLNGVLETMQQLQREQSQENGRLLIPAPRPLVLPDRLLVRGPDRLQCLSAADGAPQWIAATVDYTFRELAEQSDFSSRDDLTRELYLGQRAWCDGTSAVMACDDSRAYTVVDCGMIGAVDSIVAMQSRRHGKGAFRDNTLQAFDLRGGRQLWSIGGPPVAGNETDPFGGLFFLGAPTLHEGRLYCLVEDRGQVRLLVLDPSTEVRPTLLWTQSLLNTPPLMDVLQHEIRRTTPLSPVIQGQVVICPTGSGSVVAVDLVARQLLWTSTYQTVTPEIRRRGRMRPVQALAMQQQVALDRLLDAPRWRQSFSIWQQDRALFTIPDSDSLLCVRASDGERLWELSRENWQYVAAVDAIKVTLVGDSEIDAVRLSDGEPAWEQPTPIPPPSGAGFEHDGLYTLPLSTGEVATIDLNTGRLLARSPLVEDVLPGNLTAASGRLVSQSAT